MVVRWKIEKELIEKSLLTRVIFLVISSLSRLILPQHNPKVFISPLSLTFQDGRCYDKVIYLLFGGLTNWDAQHFYHISENGYVYEHSLAFFPLYPLVLRFLTNASTLIVGDVINPLSKLMLVSFILNSFLFTLSALVLFRLSSKVLRDESMAVKSAILYCISPSSIFFLASYSETLFSFLVFSAMLQYANGNLFRSALIFSFATACRSNGLMNVGFILHYFLYLLIINYKAFKTDHLFAIVQSCKFIVQAVLCSVIVILPYILFQIFGFYSFCKDKSNSINAPKEIIDFGKDHGFKLSSDYISWCNHTIPFPYSYVQTEYWDVGFLQYYSFKQIPNFLLAAPIALILIPYCLMFIKKYHLLFYELKPIYKPNLKFNAVPPSKNFRLLPRNTFVFTVHAFLLITFCILNINVQVTTRILCSSSPLLYWISAQHFKNNNKQRPIKILSSSPLGLEATGDVGLTLKFYYFAYVVIGLIMFSNNYPWT